MLDISVVGGTAEPGVSVIRVLIVDDHEMFAASLAHVLSAESDIEVVGTAATAAAAVPAAQDSAADVVLLDNRLPDGEGVHIIGALLDLSSQPKVVMLTATASDRLMIDAITAGAAGFIDKTRSVDAVIEAVRSAAAGESLITPAQLARLLPQLRTPAAAPVDEITAREREILQLIAEGLSNADIAARLTVSVHTVRNHVANLSTKLGAHSKLEVLAKALQRGLLPG